MSQPNSTKVTLAQCTGVTPAPVCQPANLCQREANEQKLTSVHPAQQIDSRQPLHDNNSQTSPGSTNCHKRSRTTSDSIVITPSDKRQTVLALSPERPLPAGQQWTTLEVQRVLSLTPGTKPAFKHSDCQHGSLETIQTNTAHNSPASCSPGSTVAAADSPMRHTGPINTPSTKAKACANEQGAQSMMPTDAYPATELQLPDIPPTQLACAATALDLLLYESTQIVGDPASVIIASKASSAAAAGVHGCLPIVSAQPELALTLGNADGLTATPVMMLAPAQMTHPADNEAVTHSRAPAGPVASPVAPRQAGFGTAGDAHASPALAGLSAADVVATAALEGQPQKQHAEEISDAQQQGLNPDVHGTKHAATGNQQQEQQASQVPQHEAERTHQPNAGLLLQQHRLPLPSTEPPLGTEETGSQVST